jgi:spermidine synthase
VSGSKKGLITLKGFTADHETEIHLAEPGEADRGVLWQQLVSGTYDKPFMVDDGGNRVMCFTIDGSIQSEMNVADPDALVSDYTRKMMAFLLFCPRPQHVLMLGLGGGSLAKFCHRHLPHTSVSVVEINPAVIALRRHFHVPPDDERLRIVQGDGAEFVAGMAGDGRRADALLVDAYDRRGIASSMCDPQFLENARKILSVDGVFVMNLALYESRRDGYLRLLRSVFGEPVIAVDVGWGGNTVAFAGPALRSRRRLAAAPSYARWAQAKLDLKFTKLPGLVRKYLRNTAPTERSM